MYNETYDEYIRSILGYPPINSYNNYENYNTRNNDYNMIEDEKITECYPEIYKIVYPMIKTKCNNIQGNVTSENIENMTDEIYYSLEEKDVKVAENNGEKRETRQINRGLRDLIKILLIRELLNRRRRPHFPHPPMHGPRPPMRPPFRPGMREVGIPFNSDFELSNYDIFE